MSPALRQRCSPSERLGAAAQTTIDFRAWQTWYLGRSGEHSARQRAVWPALSACFHRTLFSLERQADMAAQTRMCDRRFLKKGRGTCLSRETTNSICGQRPSSSFQEKREFWTTCILHEPDDFPPVSPLLSSGPEGGATDTARNVCLWDICTTWQFRVSEDRRDGTSHAHGQKTLPRERTPRHWHGLRSLQQLNSQETSFPKAHPCGLTRLLEPPFQARREADTRFRPPSIKPNFKKFLLKVKPCHSSRKLFLIGQRLFFS